MAKDKKIFTIEINGLTESIDAVKSLNRELNELDDKIKGLQNAKINVKVSGGNLEDTTKTKVSGGTNTDPLAKLEQQIAQQKAKDEALVTEEYQKQYQELLKIREANKDAETIQKQIAAGVRDTNGEYANTLAGQRAYLNDLQKSFNAQQIGTEEWKQTADELLRAREYVKEIEQSTGDYRRNVGNYPSGAKELVELFREQKTQIDAANASLIALKEAMENMNHDSDEYRNAAVKVSELVDRINEATNYAENLNNELSKKIQINVGGEIQYFDDLRQASLGLTQQLQSLYIAGKSGTKEFDDTIKALGQVKTAMNNVSGEVKSFIGNSKGLQDTITIMNGMSSIASLGAGLQGLFGGKNEDIDNALKKFMALTLVMNGLSTIQKQMNDETDIFGKKLNAAWKHIDKYTEGLTIVSNKYKTLSDLIEIGNDEMEKMAYINDRITEAFNNNTKTAEAYHDMMAELFSILINKGEEMPIIDDLEVLNASTEEITQRFGVEGVEAINKFKRSFDNPKEMKKFFLTLKELTNAQDMAEGKLNIFQKGLVKMNKAGQFAAKGISAISKAIKGLLASTIILLAVQLALEAIMWLFEGIGNIWDWMTGADEAKLTENFDGLAASIESANARLEEFNKLIDRRVVDGTINSYQALIQKLKNVTEATKEAEQSLKNYIAQQENVKPIDLGADYDDALGFRGGIKDMDDFENHYKILVKAVLKGQDEINAKYNDNTGVFSGHWWNALWHTASDAQSSLASMQKALISDIQYQINNIDFSQGEIAYQHFLEIINNELNASALSNIDELFPEDKWQQGLKKRIEAYKNFAEQMYGLDTELKGRMLANQQKIEDNTNAAIIDTYERGVAQRRTALERELKEAEGDEKLKESIRKKYQTQELEATIAHNKEINSRNAQARQIEIDAMKDGLEKQKAALELQKQQALQSAQDNKLSKEHQLLIIQTYNKRILDTEKDFIKSILKMYKSMNESLLQLSLGYLSAVSSIDRSIVDRRNQIKRDIEQWKLDDFIFDFKIDINTSDLNKLSKYYDALYQKRKEFIENNENLDYEVEAITYRREVEDENNRYEERLRNYQKYKDDELEKLEDNYKKGYMTTQKYNELRDGIVKDADDRLLKEEAQHVINIEQLEADHLHRMDALDKKWRKEDLDNTKDYYDNLTDLYNDYSRKIETEKERNTKKNTSQLGILNYSAEKKNLQNYINNLKTTLDKAKDERDKLNQDFNKGIISPEAYNASMDNLNDLINNTEDGLKNAEQELSNLPTTVAQQLTERVSYYTQQLANVWSMYSDLISMQLDAQEYKLEQEQKLLEEEYDMLQEQYEKQEELEKRHTDKINDIEDELKQARGDRREHLIDQLTKERDAQLKALQTEREIEKEKEQNQRKQQLLEKQQDEIEKKRKELDRKNSLVQAVVSTAAGVANALTIKPVTLGLVMAGIVGALGAAQIATIASQQYYANGGLLEGKSHKQGGIKIPNTGIEVEGGEYVVNKLSTKYNQPLIEYINSRRRPLTKDDLVNFYDNGNSSLINKNITNKFADGGKLPYMEDMNVRDVVNYTPQTDDRPIYVSVTEIESVMDNVKYVRALSGIE